MNIYTKKQRWKFYLFLIAVLIGVVSIWFTNSLVERLSGEEQKRVALWAKALERLADTNLEEETTNLDFLLDLNRSNETIPTLIVTENDSIISANNIKLRNSKGKLIRGTSNLDSISKKSYRYLQRQFEIMKKQHEPILIDLPSERQYIYYKDSIILTQLTYFPFIQIAVIFLFILVSYFAFSVSNKAEQNQVWVGMSKETAHQLGTPISSLLAWIELLKMKEENPEIITEIEKDVNRLEMITERFSKIGSQPVLMPENIVDVLDNSIKYLKTRLSKKIVFTTDYQQNKIQVPINIPLFEWVIENLCKNSIDAMNGSGNIDISIRDQNQVIYVDITDDGKGLSKNQFKLIFQPGYTTKKRGWGLGLSLTKRIIENYHEGKVFVLKSEPGVGTCIRIVLKK